MERTINLGTLNLSSFNVVFSLEWEDLFFDLSQFINLRINAYIQLFIWKHNVYKQMRRGIVLGKESALGAGRVCAN
jgi:hypothetical protein